MVGGQGWETAEFILPETPLPPFHKSEFARTTHILVRDGVAYPLILTFPVPWNQWREPEREREQNENFEFSIFRKSPQPPS